MAVSYKVVSKRPGNMTGEHAPKYYPVITNRQMVDLRYVANRISERSSFSRGDVLGVLESLVDVVPELLQSGYNVKLDDLGTFSLHVSAEGKEDPTKVTKRDITGVKMSFLASKRIKSQLKNTHFEKAK